VKKVLIACTLLISLALFAVAFLLFIQHFPALAIPFLVALGLSSLLEPLLLYWESRGHRRETGIWILFLLFVILVFFLLTFLPPFLQNRYSQLKNQIPTLLPRVVQQLKNTPLLAPVPEEKKEKWQKEIERKIQEGYQWAFHQAPRWGFQIFFSVLLTPIFLFFFLRDRRKVVRLFLGKIPNPYFERFRHLLYQVETTVDAYVRGVLTEAFLVAFLAFLILLLGKVPDPLFLATLMFFLNLIPYLGPLLATFFSGVYTFLLTESLIQTGWSAGAVLISHLMDNTLIAPLILGHAVSIHPLLVLTLLVIFGSYGGALGLVVAVPLFVLMKVLFSGLWEILTSSPR